MLNWLLFTISLGLLVATVSLSQSVSKQCEDKEKSLALLELAKDSISKAKLFIPDCEEASNTSIPEKATCGKKEKVGAFIDVSLNLINEAKDNYPDCGGVTPDVTPDEDRLPVDCLEIMQRGEKRSGVYTIMPRNYEAWTVYCDMDTDGGGWTVFQRRGDFTPQENFYRGWKDYKNGFGDLTRDFWLGNDLIHLLSNQGNNTVRFDMQRKGQPGYALYGRFRIEDEQNMYRIHIDDYKGKNGNSMDYVNGMMFSTKDKRNDKKETSESCAESWSGAWWYKSCSSCNPNGLYQPGVRNDKSVHWYYWEEDTENLDSMEIKLRRTGGF